MGSTPYSSLGAAGDGVEPDVRAQRTFEPPDVVAPLVALDPRGPVDVPGRHRTLEHVRWRKEQTLEPDWKVEHGYLVDIQGQPCVRTRLEIFPGKDFVARSFQDYMVLGMIITGMPAIHAIPHVVAAPPGIATYLDLPLVTPRGIVSS